MEKCVRAKRTTGDNIIRRMHFASWIAKATYTHSENVITYPFFFLRQQSVTGTLLSVTFIRTWPVLLYTFSKPTKKNRQEN